ncbi:hypothetical protein [Ideonella sp.]|uniref:hypothetical protein n=1 Tax=Ideonella sp. TaxID=1929293 RepID=UPI002B48CD7B|nr:hypothetical protein [Ideonella sp.]HJV71223.1 hypothetical protein [Ideonella sp.]
MAELLDDLQRMADRVEALRDLQDRSEAHAKNTAQSLLQASSQFRASVDDTLARLRVEFAALMASATEHAARSVVGEQAQVLERAAMAAVRQSLTREAIQRSRTDWLRLVATGAAIGAAAGMLTACLVIYLVGLGG